MVNFYSYNARRWKQNEKACIFPKKRILNILNFVLKYVSFKIVWLNYNIMMHYCLNQINCNRIKIEYFIVNKFNVSDSAT